MHITNKQSGTNVHEVADGIYRINTSVVMEGGPGGFSFNQFLIIDETPLLFHTGPAQDVPAGTGGGRERVARGTAALHCFVAR